MTVKDELKAAAKKYRKTVTGVEDQEEKAGSEDSAAR